MFFLLYKSTDNGVFDDFPKLSRRRDERSRTFSENFRRFPKMSEDCRRLPKIAEDFRGRPEDVSMIHQRI